MWYNAPSSPEADEEIRDENEGSIITHMVSQLRCVLGHPSSVIVIRNC
jgi:hypothetical protein